MGVKDLNNIIRKQAVSPKSMPRIDTMIIDGSNLIITYILAAAGDLIKKAPKTKFNTINRDMFYQMKYIVESAKNRGVHVLKSWVNKYKPDSIYFVLDPKNGVQYKLTTDMEISAFARSFLFDGVASTAKEHEQDIQHETVEMVSFDLKSEEQEARKKASSKKTQVTAMYDILKEKDNDVLATLYRQSFHFMEQCNCIALGKLVSSMIFSEFNKLFPSMLHVIAAEDEADLVIKNIGEREAESGNVLICSADTDYFILFANNPKVYISGLHVNDYIYSPIEQWRLAFTLVYEDGTEEQMIPDKRIFDYVIRLAPLFGNDYNRHMIISANKYENALGIFYPFSTPTAQSLRSGIGKFMAAEKAFYGPEVISTHSFDRRVYDYIVNHHKAADFKRYLYSVFVYKNYKHFSRYNEVVIEDDMSGHMKKMFDKWCAHPDPDGKYTIYDLINSGKHHKFYTWNYETDCLSKPEEIADTIDGMLEYYNSLDISDLLQTYQAKATIESSIIDELLEDADEEEKTPKNTIQMAAITIDDDLMNELLDGSE